MYITLLFHKGGHRGGGGVTSPPFDGLKGGGETLPPSTEILRGKMFPI